MRRAPAEGDQNTISPRNTPVSPRSRPGNGPIGLTMLYRTRLSLKPAQSFRYQLAPSVAKLPCPPNGASV